MFKDCEELLKISISYNNDKNYSNAPYNNIFYEEESFLFDYLSDNGDFNKSFDKIFEKSEISNDYTDSEISEKKRK